MRVNIFIRKENETKWNSIVNKSKWVNDKLQGTEVFSEVPVTDEERFKRPPDPETGWPCCERTDISCVHWVWHINKAVYINKLTGKEREAEGF